MTPEFRYDMKVGSPTSCNVFRFLNTRRSAMCNREGFTWDEEAIRYFLKEWFKMRQCPEIDDRAAAIAIYIKMSKKLLSTDAMTDLHMSCRKGDEGQ